MSPISFPKTNIYTEDIIATVNQQLMIIAALKSNVLHRLWGIINRIKDHGLEHDVLIYVHHIFCLEYERAHIVLENEKIKTRLV